MAGVGDFRQVLPSFYLWRIKVMGRDDEGANAEREDAQRFLGKGGERGRTGQGRWGRWGGGTLGRAEDKRGA